MKITFVTSKIDLERSGGSVHDLDLKVRDMIALGAQVRIVTMYSDMNRYPKDLPYEICEEQTPLRRSLPEIQRAVFPALRKYEKDTDVFHVERQFAFGTALYRRLGGKPIVLFYNREHFAWHLDGSLRRAIRHFLDRTLNRLLVSRMDHFYFSTPDLAAAYRNYGLKIPDSKVTIQPDYVDLKRLQGIIGDLPSRKENPEIVTIFASGRMIWEKGFHLLVEAIALLPEEIRRRTRTIIGGNGAERDALTKLAKEKGVDDVIEFPGWIPRRDMLIKLASSDIFAMPDWEFVLPSVMLMEAMKLGLPVVTPSDGGLAWASGKGSEMFKRRDVKSLSDALLRLIESPELRIERSREGLKHVEQFDHEKMARELFSILKNTAAKK